MVTSHSFPACPASSISKKPRVEFQFLAGCAPVGGKGEFRDEAGAADEVHSMEPFVPERIHHHLILIPWKEHCRLAGLLA